MSVNILGMRKKNQEKLLLTQRQRDTQNQLLDIGNDQLFSDPGQQ